MRCKSPSSQRKISRLHGAVVATLAVVVMACSNSGSGGGNTAGGNGFNQAPGFNSTVFSIAPAGDGTGNVYVGGDFTSYNGTEVTRLVRLKPDGTVDSAFVTGSGCNGIVRSIAQSGDGTGDLYVGGDFTSYNGAGITRLVRLHANGTVDPVFVTGVGFNFSVRSIAPAGDGSGNVYVGGDFTSYNGTPANDLVRLHANGTVDLTFVTGTGFTGAGLNTGVRSIAPAGDGSGNVYVGGGFTSYNGTVANDLVRLRVSNGTVDPAFAMGTGFNDTVFSIAPAGDGTGDLYVGGAFTSYNTTPVNDLVRLNANGTLDPAFATGTGFDNTVFSITPAGDGTGNVYVGGDFTSYHSTTIGRIARLNSKGSPS